MINNDFGHVEIVFNSYLCTIKIQKNISFNKENFKELLRQNQEQSDQLSELKQELEWLKRQLFGRKSERFEGLDSNQLQLQLEELEEKIQQQSEELQEISYKRSKNSKEGKQGHGRMPIPSHLRREEIIIEPEEVPEGVKKIGEEITEVMEYKKAEIYVKKYIRPK